MRFSNFWTMNEEWKKDTTTYIKTLKDKAPNKQTKTYLDGLLKHLGKEGFLSDEQKSSLANITKGAGSSSKDSSKDDATSTISGVKGTSSKTSEKPEKIKKTKKETGKEIKKQIGSLLGKLGGFGKEMASKVDSKAVDAIDKGVAGGASVKDATKDVVDKIKDDLIAKKEEKELAKKKKEEIKKQKKAKNESFENRFNEYLK